jgi:hypothetical protein
LLPSPALLPVIPAILLDPSLDSALASIATQHSCPKRPSCAHSVTRRNGSTPSLLAQPRSSRT